MPKSALRLADPLPHARQHNGIGQQAAEAASSFPGALVDWYKELVSLIPKETRKLVRKSIRKAAARYGPEIATAIATGVVTSLLTSAAAEPKKKKKKKKKK
jgi:hypothetical protein